MRRLNGRRWSLKRTLLTILLGLTLSLWAGSAAIVYVEARRESDTLFDQSLAETGYLLLSLVENEVRENALGSPASLPLKAPANPYRYLLFQVRDAHGQLLYKSDGAPDALLSGDAPTGFSWATRNGERLRVFALWDDAHQIQMLVAEPTRHRDSISHRFFYKTVLFGALLAACAVVAIWWSIRRVFLVLQRSADQVAARTPNDLADVALRGVPSEMYPLLLAINTLFGRVRRTMEYEQRFTADAAHELRTPLAAIKTNLQVIKRARSDAERDEFIAGLSTSVDRASRLVDQLMTLEQLDPQGGADTALAPGDLAILLRESAGDWQAECARKGLTLTVEAAAAPCRLHAGSMRMLIRNLVDNAMRYTPAPGEIVLRCGQRDGISFLDVSDTGPGIPPAMQERVFERFFRLAGAQLPGSGLGLSIVRRIAERHGAQVTLGPRLHGTGLCVRVVFPSASA
ncbi:MAG: ATP-binding protein [Pseudomonadota bacterium]|nr:ATP-binding protein [Pseudomonadota bacterium]